ncbi:sorbosone dehydrogenase family protein [Mycobacterium sp. 1274761.0]|uniref:PQQ-dependent sugar dehydrogenase n=1 Tax=Mycobacterium sp. 1274761.0 TaxID=1834077 RepID=UPI000800332B|nr:gluconolaconase [Mycobacterium sp. 1274761.0]OBK71802.1 gluconolaconase [Mycobacterium sp. 1274761.0]
MRIWLGRNTIASALVGVALLAGCSSEPPQPQAPPSTPSNNLVSAPVDVPARFAQAPFDEPRHAMIPGGWSLSVWARIPKARLAVWTPDKALLVSVPATGQIVKLTPKPDAAPDQSVLLDGLEQPHGMAFAGSTLYVAESDQIDAYDYAGGAAVNRRTIADDLPDARSPELRGAYAHALKSVAVGHDGAVYFSIGSTGNVSAEDRDADPPRATIMWIPPGGGRARPFATGVRNGTGLAVAPDGSVWTAVNNRDNAPDPRGNVDMRYVNDHPPESLARLTPGREMGWPFCNPEGGPSNLPFIRDMSTNRDGSRMDCAALSPVEQSLGAHAAPLGLAFTTGLLPPPYANGALVGVHGSWNRQPPQAPEVSFFAWRAGTLGNQQTLVGGFQADDGSRWGRPVAAVPGPDGAVYITDDDAGAVYRLTPRGR